MKMKQWLIDYSVRHIDGRIEERQDPIVEKNIHQALAAAQRDIIDPLKTSDPEVSDAVIWDVGIVAELEDPAAVF